MPGSKSAALFHHCCCLCLHCRAPGGCSPSQGCPVPVLESKSPRGGVYTGGKGKGAHGGRMWRGVPRCSCRMLCGAKKWLLLPTEPGLCLFALLL